MTATLPRPASTGPASTGPAPSKRSRVLMKGNEAIAEAAIQAGCDAYFGYPITPQAELLEWMARRMPELGRAFIQAESELGAINMALGAAATGARVLVSTSSPGMSLMAEAMSYMAGSETPMVLVNVMRGGPGLGSIGPCQSGLLPGGQGPRPRRLPGPGPGAGLDRRGGGAGGIGLRDRRALSHAGDPAGGRRSGSGDGAGRAALPHIRRGPTSTGPSPAPMAGRRASSARSTSSRTARGAQQRPPGQVPRDRATGRSAGRASSSTTPTWRWWPMGRRRGSPTRR